MSMAPDPVPPQAEGIKKNTDGSQMFRFINGPYDKRIFRIYGTERRVSFPGVATYELAAPEGRQKKWHYRFLRELTIEGDQQ